MTGLCVPHCSVPTRNLHAAEKHSSRRKLQGGKLQKSGSRAQTLASYLEEVTSWGEMTHLQLQKQGVICLRRLRHVCMICLLQYSWADQKSSHADAQHCWFAQMQAVFHIGGVLRVQCCCLWRLTILITWQLVCCLTCRSCTAVWDRHHCCHACLDLLDAALGSLQHVIPCSGLLVQLSIFPSVVTLTW